MESRKYDKIVNRDEITEDAASAFADAGQSPPEKYIRTEEVLDGVVIGEDESYELPVVDMARLAGTGDSFRFLLFRFSHLTFVHACPTNRVDLLTSSFYIYTHLMKLMNHGADEAVVQQMKDNTVQFFNSPLESKKKVAVREKGLEGFGHHYSRASVGKLDWAESMILITQPPQDRNMEMWPTNPPTFRDALEVYSVEMISLAKRLLGFLDAFADKRQSMAIHYYPPCRHREKVMGITPHTGGLGLTLLLHVDDTPGLQIRKAGRWFPVRPLPGAFVVNVADILDVLSNGAYRSVQHRVLPDAERGRTTVVIFQESAVDGMVAPLPGLVKKAGGEARYKSIEVEEYIKGNFNALAHGTRFIESLRI